jgi:hypothetical protein
MNSDNESILEKLKEYPSSEDEILETWSIRESLWAKLNEDGGGRVDRCHRASTKTYIDTNTFEYV